MTFKNLSFRLIIRIFTITILLLILSNCDIIDLITDEFKGNDDVNGTVGPGYGLLGTVVIGPAGGEINLDSIIVNVPSGAFDENTEISISVGIENDGFNEYGISALYQISGLPSTIDKPIRLSIKYHGTLEGDTLIAIGEMHYATSLDSSLYSYETYNASDSSGYLVYNLPVYTRLAKYAQPGDTKIFSQKQNLIAVGGYVKKLSADGHFMLSYPLAYNTQATLMGDHFEKAYKTCEDMGFDLSARSFIADPAFVLVKPLNPRIVGWYSQYNPGQYITGIWNVTTLASDEDLRFLIPTGNFTINQKILSNDLELRTTVGHEFLHLVQHLYEFYTLITPEQRWLEEATAVWIEAKYANVSNFISSSYGPSNYGYPFSGWQSEDLLFGRSHASYGYGLSVIIKGIVERYGDGAVVKIFEKVKDGILPSNATDPVDAVLSVLDESVGNFWHGVLGSFILGKYYNSQVNFTLLDDYDFYEDIFTIDAQNNVHSITNYYHDLSGMKYKVIPGDLSTLTTVPISFTVADPVNCGILVCKYKKGTEITPVGEVFPGGSGVVILDDAKPIFDAGYELVVMVSNSSHNKSKNYQEEKNIEVTIELLGDILNGKMEFYLDNALSTNSSDERSIKEVLHFNGLNGKFINDRYEGSYLYESLGRTYSGNVKITFIDNPESIDFHLNGQYTYESLFGLFGTVTFSYTVDYSGMPYEGIDPNSGQFVYSESGSAVQNGQFTWSETNWGGTNDESIDNLISYNCGADAYIIVEVDKRE